MRKNLRRVRKEDYSRVVLTESCPYETPLIFSNFNFYQILKKLDTSISEEMAAVYKKIISKKFNEHTIPLTYSIRKSEDTLRHLSLLHPASQIEAIELYRDFEQQIINACKKSNFSIRRPGKVASKYYIRDEKKGIPAYRSADVAVSKRENLDRYLTSYYSYNGYTRLYRFFESQDFFRLEKKYLYFWSLDVTQCFDSIYTHSVAWSLKTKAFSKHHKNEKNTLGSCFDRLMQAANYNETSGIIIGPEISRIFAEIIFQKIDADIEKHLLSDALIHGEHYDLRRYVDDYYLFSSNEAICNKVQRTIEEKLKNFKLNLNTSKTTKLNRPFVTQKTASLRQTKETTAKLLDAIVDKTNDEKDREIYTPKTIKKPTRLVAGFINDIKTSCIGDTKAYELSCNYLVATLSNTILRITSHNGSSTNSKDPKVFEDAYNVLTKLAFHFFTISPTYNGSVSICKITHTLCKFYEDHFPSEVNTIKSLIYTSCLDFVESGSFSKMSQPHLETHLEILNIIITIRLLGDDYLIPRSTLEKILKCSGRTDFSYFEITTILFYIQDHPAYRSLKSRIESVVKTKLNDISDLNTNAEKAYLALDILACPYISSRTKKAISEKMFSDAFRSKASNSSTEAIIFNAGKWGWFSSWDEVSILSNLEKKQLLKGY